MGEGWSHKALSQRSNNLFKEITIRTGGDGYKNVVLHINGIQKSYRINRLMTMITGGVDNDKVVDHVDGDITNNSTDNLEEVDHTENVRRGKCATKIFKDRTVDKIFSYIYFFLLIKISMIL